MLRLYGYSRTEALDLPHKEFWHVYTTHFKLKAQDTLDLRQAVGSLFGDSKDYVQDLQRRAGLLEDPEPEEEDRPWTMGLFDLIGGAG